MLLLLLLAATHARAHKPSDSYLTLKVNGSEITGRWDIHLRDLDFAIGLDADGDGRITWGELRASHEQIAAYASARLGVLADGQRCSGRVGEQQVDEHSDGAYTVLMLSYACPAEPKSLSLDYTLFADIDPQHRGLLSLTGTGGTRAAVLGQHAPQQAFAIGAPASSASQLWAYLREGVWHIWIGFDHILFLVSLLLPAVVVWSARGPAAVGAGHARKLKGPAGGWQPATAFSPALWDVVRVVTAFTLAHSVTLSLAALGYVSLPSRLVESAIAASVVLAALNNVWPLFRGRRWTVAFVFGLIHGFGFASVLADLGLPQGALALALLGFNLGVEAGQLAIVLVFLPLAWALRRTWFYRRAVLLGGSLLIALLAGLWFVERALDVAIF
ncbi:MAG TPA: HupE/UreJ family protein [Rubrivivax sp.]|nr:HupE/UreJ family protein [Rubrivivax sp.]